MDTMTVIQNLIEERRQGAAGFGSFRNLRKSSLVCNPSRFYREAKSSSHLYGIFRDGNGSVYEHCICTQLERVCCMRWRANACVDNNRHRALLYNDAQEFFCFQAFITADRRT